jgi:hypothetical protein
MALYCRRELFIIAAVRTSNPNEMYLFCCGNGNKTHSFVLPINGKSDNVKVSKITQM